MRTDTAPGRRHERGFSLIELVVSMFIAVQILIAAAIAFDVHNRMARVQTQITDLQQSLRVAQYGIVRTVRSAGRGSLPMDLDPDAIYDPTDTVPFLRGLAVEVRNNVTDDDRYIARGDNTSPQALDGTDILTVRGCLGGSIYQIDPSTFDWDPDDNDIADVATLDIERTSLAGILQPLGPLMDEINAYADDAPIKGRMVLTSPESLQNYGIANISSAAITGAASDPDTVTLTLRLDTNSPLNPVDLSTGVRTFPDFMTVALGCFVEEYRFYIRTLPGDVITPLRPRLSRARFEPGTETAYQNDTSNWTLDLSDGIFDLQVALGLDSDYTLNYDATLPGSFNDDDDDIGVDDTIYEAAAQSDAEDRTRDDWLHNDPADRPADAQYMTHAFGTNAGQLVQVYFVRITTVGRTLRPDRGYAAPDFDTRTDGDWVEDHDYDSGAALQWKSGDALKFRRRSLTTIVEMRNI
jgi:type II secretory pathway pseudopilin PulG